MADRRYDDEEIAAIFRTAAEHTPAPQTEAAPAEGLTLADLQAIGREVGIAPDAVASAALALDARGGATPRRFLGMPIGVRRTVDLNRRMTDEERERLVVRLREVFDARGSTRSDGSLRQWTNGNLHVLLEPTATGHRLRFGTVHGSARSSIASGMLVLGVAGVLSVLGAIGGQLGTDLPMIGVLVATGGALVASGALRLPRWARLRGRQMDALSDEVTKALPPADPPPSLPPA